MLLNCLLERAVRGSLSGCTRGSAVPRAPTTDGAGEHSVWQCERRCDGGKRPWVMQREWDQGPGSGGWALGDL